MPVNTDIDWSKLTDEQVLDTVNETIEHMFVTTRPSTTISIGGRGSGKNAIIHPDAWCEPEGQDLIDEVNFRFRDVFALLDEWYRAARIENQPTKQKHPPRSFSNRGKGKRKQW